jgi:hypothetical protein
MDNILLTVFNRNIKIRVKVRLLLLFVTTKLKNMLSNDNGGG